MAQSAIVTRQFIFEKAQFAQCHASTIVEVPGGLLAAWFGGPKEGDPRVEIWVSVFSKGYWSEPRAVAAGYSHFGQQYPCWNPVLFRFPDGLTALFYKVGPSPSSWWGQWMVSHNNGLNWERPSLLPPGIIGPVKNKPVLLPDGRLLCGSSTEHAGWRVHFEWTADQGKSWERTESVNDGEKLSAIQPTILTLEKPSHIRALGRTRQRRIFAIDSFDAGYNWEPMRLTELPNPNSGIDAVTLRDGRHLLVYNHTEQGRFPLNVAVSEDGESWYAALVLEEQPGEFSYPAVIQDSEGYVHITYTWNRLRIAHVVLDPARLKLRPIQSGLWPAY